MEWILANKNFNHEIPVGSLRKIKRNDISKFPNIPVIIQPKIDGVNITLYFENGNLVKAGTSGDGLVGKDVTHHFKHISGLPDGWTTGEVVANGLNRAKVAGIVNRKDKIILSEKLLFYPHEEIESISGNLSLELVDNALEKFKIMPYDTDGIVIKIANQQHRKKLGCDTRYRPKWAWAIKFDVPKFNTVIMGIGYRVGETGRTTPVLVIKPVQTGSGTITCVNMHTVSNIEKYNLYVGKRIKVELAGGTTPTLVV